MLFGVVDRLNVFKLIGKDGELVELSVAVGYGGNLVEASAASVPALHGVGIGQAKASVKHDSPAALF